MSTCEFCGGGFSASDPNEGTHRDFHGVCGTRYSDTPCGRLMTRFEKELACTLTEGQASDLLLDNFMEIADSREAHEIARGCLLPGVEFCKPEDSRL